MGLRHYNRDEVFSCPILFIMTPHPEGVLIRLYALLSGRTMNAGGKRNQSVLKALVKA